MIDKIKAILERKGIYTISVVAILLLGVTAIATQISADDIECTDTVTAPSSIQTAVDGASSDDVVCLSDADGAFAQTVVFGPEDSGITLTAAPGESPVLDGATLAGTGPTSIDAITLEDGVTEVTIEGLTIQNYKGDSGGNDRSSAITTWNVETSGITVRNNNLLDNFWNGILVGSNGGEIHEKWVVEDNVVDGHGFVGIELTNCDHCEIHGNDVDNSGFAGIVLKAGNIVPGTGLITIEDVKVVGNTVDDSGKYGIYILSFQGIPGDPFDPITGAQSLLTTVTVEHNTITDSGIAGIVFWAYNDATTAQKGDIKENEVNCDPVDSADGIRILERGSGTQMGTVKEVTADKNTIESDCVIPVLYEGRGADITIKETIQS